MVARTPEAFAKSGIEVRTKTEVVGIRPESGEVRLGDGSTLHFDHLVIATGAQARTLGVEGEELPGVFALRDLSDAMRIKAYLHDRNARRAVVIGSGFIGLELCEAFREQDMDVTLVNNHTLPMHRLGEEFGGRIIEELETHQILHLPETMAQAVDSASDGSLQVHTADSDILQTDIVIVAIGVVPEVALANSAGVRIGDTGAVATDDRMQTNLPSVYAAGDCCECRHRVSGKPVWVPLGDTANKQGRIAGINIGGGRAAFPGIIGSSCFKVFGLHVATTGLTEKEAGAAGFEPRATTIRGSSRPHYYPGARTFWLRLVSDRETGRVVGAQAVGYGGAVEHVNILAAAITAEMTVEDLAYADFAYAPPFGGAWDPIHIAAQKLTK